MAKYNEGRYWVKATGQGVGKAGTGTAFFELGILVRGIINLNNPDGDLLPCDPGERRIRMYLTEATAEFTIENLEAIGFDKPSLKFLDPSTPDYHNFTDKEFEALCLHEAGTGENKGKTFEKWSVYTRKERQPLEPVAASELSKLDALFGKQLQRFKKGPAPQRSEPVAESVGSVAGLGVSDEQRNASKSRPDRDEIPF
jgi:hypothetical protein